MKTEEQIVREFLSAKAKSRWADPEYRERQMTARKAWWANPANRARHAEGQRKRRSKANG